MLSVSLSLGSACLALLLSSVTAQRTYFLPQLRNEGESNNAVETIPFEPIKYQQIYPEREYNVALKAVEPKELSILDYVLSPITAVVSLGSTALSVITWVVIKGGWILLGVALVIGLCAFTSFCDLTIQVPNFLGRENLSTIPYLEDIEYYFNKAYNKYEELQRSL